MRIVLFLLLLSTCGIAAAADTAYISDVLHVGIRTNPNSTDTPIAVLTSGTAVTVLQHGDGYTQIRTPDGVEGWISDGYVTTDVPPRQQLADMTKQRDQLQAQLNKLKADSAASANSAAELGQLQQENSALQQTNEQLSAQAQSANAGRRWLYYGLGLLAVFLYGIYRGVRWHKGYVAKRIGGFEL